MNKRYLKRNAIIYTKFQDRCFDTYQYFFDKRSDSKKPLDETQLLYELIEERMIRKHMSGTRSRIFSLIDEAEKFKRHYDKKFEEDHLGILQQWENNSFRQFNKYFQIEYPIADILHDIGVGDICEIELNDLTEWEPEDINDTYPAFQPSRRYKPLAMLDALKKMYGKKLQLNEKFINMPMIRPRKRTSNWNTKILMEIDPTKPREEAHQMLDAFLDVFQNDSHHMHPLDVSLSIEKPRKLKVFKSLKDYDIFRVNTVKPFPYRMADALFIYDCKRLKETKEYAKKEIDAYWHSIRLDLCRKRYLKKNPNSSEISIKDHSNKYVKYKKIKTETYNDLLILAERIMGDEFEEFLSGVEKA